jgi:hypothetical protein
MCDMRMFKCEKCGHKFRDPEGTINKCAERVLEHLDAKEAGEDVGDEPTPCPPLNVEKKTYGESYDIADEEKSDVCPECKKDGFWD